MKKFQVITDSTSDMIKKDREEYGIDYFKMSFSIDDVEYDADLDWGKMTADEYYISMRNGKRSITSMVKPEEVEPKLREYLSQGLDVLYVACSSKLSGSVNYVQNLSEDILKDYPERKVIVFDSLRSNYAEGLIAIDAAKMANEGKSVDEAFEVLNKEKLQYQTLAIVGSLEWLRKAGRVKAAAAFFGNIIGIKPVLIGAADGNNFAFEKIKGRAPSIERLIDLICERCTEPSDKTVYIEHANCIDVAEYIKGKVEERIHPKEIVISNVGPIIGATVGPDTITANFKGKEVDIYSE